LEREVDCELVPIYWFENGVANWSDVGYLRGSAIRGAVGGNNVLESSHEKLTGEAMRQRSSDILSQFLEIFDYPLLPAPVPF
jgi:hypothetical protein